MSQTFANPENALKRASGLSSHSPTITTTLIVILILSFAELIVVNQKNEAIDVLRTIITSRRHRTWQKSLESVMVILENEGET